MRYITRAGIPLLEGLRDLRDTMEKRGFRDVLTALLEDLEGGKVLSQALAAHPAVFGAVFVHSVRAGEQTGLLDAVFDRLAESLKWQEEVAAKAKRLMIYPALVLASSARPSCSCWCIWCRRCSRWSRPWAWRCRCRR